MILEILILLTALGFIALAAYSTLSRPSMPYRVPVTGRARNGVPPTKLVDTRFEHVSANTKPFSEAAKYNGVLARRDENDILDPLNPLSPISPLNPLNAAGLLVAAAVVDYPVQSHEPSGESYSTPAHEAAPDSYSAPDPSPSYDSGGSSSGFDSGSAGGGGDAGGGGGW